jgi:hypothetical protein
VELADCDSGRILSGGADGDEVGRCRCARSEAEDSRVVGLELPGADTRVLAGKRGGKHDDVARSGVAQSAETQDRNVQGACKDQTWMRVQCLDDVWVDRWRGWQLVPCASMFAAAPVRFSLK